MYIKVISSVQWIKMVCQQPTVSWVKFHLWQAGTSALFGMTSTFEHCLIVLKLYSNIITQIRISNATFQFGDAFYRPLALVPVEAVWYLLLTVTVEKTTHWNSEFPGHKQLEWLETHQAPTYLWAHKAIGCYDVAVDESCMLGYGYHLLYVIHDGGGLAVIVLCNQASVAVYIFICFCREDWEDAAKYTNEFTEVCDHRRSAQTCTFLHKKMIQKERPGEWNTLLL